MAVKAVMTLMHIAKEKKGRCVGISLFLLPRGYCGSLALFLFCTEKPGFFGVEASRPDPMLSSSVGA